MGQGCRRSSRLHAVATTSPVRISTGPSTAACRLTVAERGREARRYWDIAPHLFKAEAIRVPQRPCPFADGRYQLMRNLAFAFAWAERDELPNYGFLLSDAASAPSAARAEAELAAFKNIAPPERKARIGLISYEDIAEILREAGDDLEVELADWIQTRIGQVTGRATHLT